MSGPKPSIGNDVSYAVAHRRVIRDRGAASGHNCIDCGYSAGDWSYRGGSPVERTCTMTRKGKESQYSYSPDPTYYDPRCRSCHISYDWGKKHMADNHETYIV